MELVKKILVDLHKSLKDTEENERKRLVFKRLDPFDFVKTRTNPSASPKSVRSIILSICFVSMLTQRQTSKKYDSLFDVGPTIPE